METDLNKQLTGYWPRHRVICFGLSMAMLASMLTAMLVIYSRKDTFIYAIEVIEGDMEADRFSSWEEGPNNRPIIGVLSQELDDPILARLPKNHNYTSYIAASYVKWIESGGARAVPVIIGRERSHYEQLFAGLNGLLLPGGSAPLVGPGGYAEVGRIFFDLAKQANDRGDFFPIWGTCNGFELLTVMSMQDDTSRLTDCYSEDQASPLHLLPNWRRSKIYGKTPPHILNDLVNSPVTINFHRFCLTPTNFTRFGLGDFWYSLSLNWDTNGLEYISTIEAKHYPFIGTQFHPEKNVFEWCAKEVNIPHSQEAVNVANYFGRFFVRLARSSLHKFNDREEEKYLIYNYRPMYTGKRSIGMGFEETYLFSG